MIQRSILFPASLVIATGIALGAATLLFAEVKVAPANPAAAPAASAQPARKPDIHYVPTPEEVAEEMLRTAAVGKEDLVYDLGCGDGRIVIMAAKQFGARGIGIDIDPQRITEATANAKQAGVTDRVAFLTQDLFLSDFKDATVIALYLLTSLNEQLRPKILAETKPGTRVVSHAFSMGPWQADISKSVDGIMMYYWVVPANLSGQWKYESNGAGLSAVTIKQSFQKFTGTATVGGKPRTISNGQITGADFTFTLDPDVPGAEPMKIAGRIAGEEIKATTGSGEKRTTVTARRQKGSMGRVADVDEPSPDRAGTSAPTPTL